MYTEILNLKDSTPSFEAVMVYGHFSTIHPGHIRYLKYAKLQEINIIALLGKVKILNINTIIHKRKSGGSKITIFI